MSVKIKTKIKKTFIFPYLVRLRTIFRVFYSTKSRSRFFWNLRSGDIKLSLDYPLSNESVVLVVGAFEGDYLNKLNNKFKCKVYAFEPVVDFFKILEKKFQHLDNVILINKGLSDKTEKVNFSIDNESSSVFTDTEKRVLVHMISINDFFETHEIKHIDFIYMNIEGGEFVVLNELIKNGWIKNINHLQIQFHNVTENSRDERRKIRKELEKTHYCVFNFPFIWERWDKKK